MKALLLISTDRIRERLHAALQRADHQLTTYTDPEAASAAIEHSRPDTVFVEHPHFTGMASPSCPLPQRECYVLIAVLPPDASPKALTTAPALEPDFILDRWRPASLRAHMTLIERRSKSQSTSWTAAHATSGRTWLNTFFGRSQDSVYVIDRAGTILDANPAACQVHGVERTDLQGRVFDSVVALPDDCTVSTLFDDEQHICSTAAPNQEDCLSVTTLATLRITYDHEETALIHVSDQPSASSFAEAVLNRASAYAVQLDAQGTISRLNAACADQLDPSFHPTNSTFGELFFPEDRAAAVDAALRELDPGDPPQRHGTWWVADDGSDGYIAWTDTLHQPDSNPVDAAPPPQTSDSSPPPSGTLPLLSKALEKVSDAVLIADATRTDLPTVYCNPAFESMTGYRRHEVLGRNCRFLQGPDTDSAARATLRTALNEGTSCQTTIKNYRKDGTPFWNEITIFPVRDASGAVTHFLGILHDITEQRARRQQIERGEQYLRQIVDALPQFIFLKNEAGEYLLANESVAAAYGTTPDQMEGATDQEFAAASEGRDFRADDHAVIRSNEPREFIETIEDASARERIVKTELLPFQSVHAEERLLLGISTDITEQVRTEEALRQERDLLDNIMSTSVAAIAVVDTAGRFVFANDRAEDLLELIPNPNGYPYDLPQWRLTTLDEAQLAGDTHPFQRVMRTGEPVFGAERAVEWPDGHRRLLSINAAPLTDDNGNVVRVVTSIEDITERKAAERALQISEERWRQLVRYHPEPILISSDATIKYINAAGARVFGADSPDDIIGRSILEFAEPAVHDTIEERISTIEDGGQTSPLEHRLRRLDGEERIVQAFSVPITYDGARSAQTVVRDVTAQKSAEQALRVREQQQATLAELGLYALEESDLQALMTEAVARLTETLDIKHASVLELKSDLQSIRLQAPPPDSAPPVHPLVPLDQFPLARHTLRAEEAVRVGPDERFTGEDFPLASDVACGVCVRIPGRDQPYGILSACAAEARTFTKDDVNFLQTVAILISDAVERTRTEVELLLSEKRYRTVVEQQTELICRFAPDGMLTFVNHAFEAFLGTPAEELTGQAFESLLLPSDRDAFREIESDFSADQPVQKYEFRLLSADGEERWLQWAIRAFVDPSGDVAEFQASGRDITERKLLEREILEVSARERRHIGQDLHDGLGSHLSGVSMLCRGVIRKIEAGEAVDKTVIEEISQLVQESIKQVRKLARGLNPVKMEDEGLPSALQELVSTTRAHPGISVAFDHDNDVPDPDSEVALQLYRIAQEAITNALKHADADQIVVRLGTKDGALLLTIADDGRGISPHPQAQSGMGLRVMKYRANTIGAQLRIRPRPDGGTAVQCALPLNKLPSPPRPQSIPS